MKRRTVISAIASLPFFGGMFTTAVKASNSQIAKTKKPYIPYPRPPKSSLHSSHWRPCKSFVDLKAWIDELGIRQIKGCSMAVCPVTGVLYTGIGHRALCRPQDKDRIEQIVATEMQQSIADLIERRVKNQKGWYPEPNLSGVSIQWREPLEWDVLKAPQIIDYCEVGPDRDIFDKPCIMDHDWIKVVGWCRLDIAVDGHPIPADGPQWECKGIPCHCGAERRVNMRPA